MSSLPPKPNLTRKHQSKGGNNVRSKIKIFEEANGLNQNSSNKNDSIPSHLPPEAYESKDRLKSQRNKENIPPYEINSTASFINQQNDHGNEHYEAAAIDKKFGLQLSKEELVHKEMGEKVLEITLYHIKQLDQDFYDYWYTKTLGTGHKPSNTNNLKLSMQLIKKFYISIFTTIFDYERQNVITDINEKLFEIPVVNDEESLRRFKSFWGKFLGKLESYHEIE
ncbi:hypothetical protein BN7_1689 [Wickerhamomyces ciferrii]|uniref:Transcriptional protein SWT1 C-terminal domain-containing protein n=1 Tax=Wickerhamomyces ciferrii (strain ATCC 14091 / BCRC 22168 / CBS 111 / JCM 3599 / NBRC 0793 / NRRL Y-1031 F-60-10) TaxID=1206466 RepID=K0KL49_WICCF|nr:uncharacterized protein BN7_1689 [Wickerhamomyces ciferrii]CCH42144.1 hypothetical protein BN7_1689 [Wickerhamomyces ciferrii]